MRSATWQNLNHSLHPQVHKGELPNPVVRTIGAFDNLVDHLDSHWKQRKRKYQAFKNEL